MTAPQGEQTEVGRDRAPGRSAIPPARLAFMLGLALLSAFSVYAKIPNLRANAVLARAESARIEARAATRLLYFYIPSEQEGEDTRSGLFGAMGFPGRNASQALAEAAADRYEDVLDANPGDRDAQLNAALLRGYVGDNEAATKLLASGGMWRQPAWGFALDAYMGKLPRQPWRPGPEVMSIANSQPAGPLLLLKVYTALGEPEMARRAIAGAHDRSVRVLVLICLLAAAGGAGVLVLIATAVLLRWRKPGRWQAPAFVIWHAVEVILLWFALTVAVVPAGFELLRRVAPQAVPQSGLIWVAVVAYLLPAGISIIWFLRASVPAGERKIGSLGWRGWRGAPAGIAGYCAIQPLLLVVFVAIRLLGGDPTPASPALPVIAGASGVAQKVCALILAAVAAPLFEETLFRGILYGALRRTMRPLFAAPISGIAFGLVHMDLISVATFAVLGIVLAYLYERTGSLAAPAVCHGLVNAVSVIALTVVS